MDSKTIYNLHKLWCAVLGLNQWRLAKRRGRFPLICYLRTFVVTWTLADLAGRTCPAKRRERRRGGFDAADTELRRLIREGFESGIPGEQLADAAGLSVPRLSDPRRATVETVRNPSAVGLPAAF
jgi:hypothetical protein